MQFKNNELELAILRAASEADAAFLSDGDLLKKGRSGQISIYFKTIASILNIPVEKIANTISSAKDSRYQGAIIESNNPIPPGMENLRLNSRCLPVLLKDMAFEVDFDEEQDIDGNNDADSRQEEQTVRQDVSEDTDDTADTTDNPPAPKGKDLSNSDPFEHEKAPARPARTPSRKKTKYTMNKTALVDMLTGSMDTEDTREIRAFLLSLPDYKPQDVALMTDKQVVDIFLKDYKCLTMTGGTLILPVKDFDKLTAFLGGLETYFISRKESDTED